MVDSDFIYSKAQLQEMAESVLLQAKQMGATNAIVDVHEGGGLSVGVRKNEVETIEQNKDKGVSVTVFVGQRRGSANTSDFSAKSLRETVSAALNIARFTAEDEYAGLPEVSELEMAPRDLQLHYPWYISVEDAVALAQRTEEAAMRADNRISNSEGADVSIQDGHFVTANTQGFNNGYAYSRHSMSVSPIAGKGENMQRDFWYSSERNAANLLAPEEIGRIAAERAVRRLNAKRLDTRQCPVLFEAPLATGLLGTLVRATAGSALYRKSTFLLDSLGKTLFPSHIQVHENPHIIGAIGSSPFDDEGVVTRPRDLVEDGVLQGYFLSTYSARRLGMKTTGNAGGAHNLFLRSTQTQESDDLNAMLKKMGTGLFVTELMGQGMNFVTGDYSRGASGFWVENGEIQYPVEEITIAGNMKEMWQQIVAIGADTQRRGALESGSILIENMMVAGS